MLFDWLVVGQVLPFNPAASVRGPKHVVKTGKTPVLSAAETRALLDGIDLSTLAGLRDRALLGVLVYSFARVSAAVSLRVADYYTQGPRSFFRLHEKGGRYNVVPAHHTAQAYVGAYLAAAGIGEDRRGSLFRPCPPGRNDALLDQPMTRTTTLKMIKRRAGQAGLPTEICAHSFRGTGITEYLRNGGDLKVAARIAGHESTRTTQLYNRLQEEISLDEIGTHPHLSAAVPGVLCLSARARESQGRGRVRAKMGQEMILSGRTRSSSTASMADPSDLRRSNPRSSSAMSSWR